MRCNFCQVRQPDFTGMPCRVCKRLQDGTEHPATPKPPQASPEGLHKAEICRSNTCGFYDAERDCCKILADKGKAGRITYLLSHPTTRCVAENPLF